MRNTQLNDRSNMAIDSPHPNSYLRKIYYFLGIVILLLMTAFVYAPVSYLSFSGPDDHWMLLKNPYIIVEQYDWSYFKAIFNRVNDVQYSPLNTLYYSLVYRINGFDPYYFHVLNVIFHFGSTLSIFFFSEKILVEFKIGDKLWGSFITAMMWCIHPMNVEAVAWISGSKILICTLCTLVSFNLFISGYLRGQTYKLFFSLLFFVISFYFKEQAIITPIMFLAFIVFHKWNTGHLWTFKWGEIAFVILLFILDLYFIWYSFQVNYGIELTFPPIKYYPISQKFLLICYCAFFYFSNVIFPRHLHYNYHFPFGPYEIVPFEFYIYPILLLVALIAFFFLIRHSEKKKFNLFCGCICLSQIALELQVIPMTRPAIMADRYMYFPMITLILAIVASLSQIRRYKVLWQVFYPILLFYMLYMAVYCNNMANYWQKLNLIK